MLEVKEVVQEIRLKEWAEIIQEQKSSGLSARAWCKDNDIGQGKFYYWLNKLRKATIEHLPEGLNKTSFVPIKVSSVVSNVTNSIANSPITIRKGDISIEFNNDTPLDTITSILEALQC